jgi:MtN3 and saliva related transmembrane protein
MSWLVSDITFSDLVGIVAGIFSTLSFLPQAIKVWRTHSTHDLSLGMYILYTSALFL